MAISLGPSGLQLNDATHDDYADFAGGGKVLQVKNTVDTSDYSTTSTSFQTTTTLSITPSSTSSKILIIASVPMGQTRDRQEVRLFRGSTGLNSYQAFQGSYDGDDDGWNNTGVTGSFTFLDSPSTTSATTYSVKHRKTDGAGGTAYVGRSGANYMGRTDIMITLMEISG